jgi:hypothetical protein
MKFFVPEIDQPFKVRGTAIRPDDTPQQYLQKLARITLDEMFQLVGVSHDGWHPARMQPRPSRTGWAWGWRTAHQSSKSMAAARGRHRERITGRSFMMTGRVARSWAGGRSPRLERQGPHRASMIAVTAAGPIKK